MKRSNFEDYDPQMPFNRRFWWWWRAVVVGVDSVGGPLFTADSGAQAGGHSAGRHADGCFCHGAFPALQGRLWPGLPCGLPDHLDQRHLDPHLDQNRDSFPELTPNRWRLRTGRRCWPRCRKHCHGCRHRSCVYWPRDRDPSGLLHG